MTANSDTIRLTIELGAMETVYNTIKHLSQGERDRVMTWVSARLFADGKPLTTATRTEVDRSVLEARCARCADPDDVTNPETSRKEGPA